MSVGTNSAAIAAAAMAELMRQEEEEMTPYSDKDLAEGWEFKIVRGAMGAFSRPERLRAVLDEEKKGGWVLVEKFDDCRIRLKRRAGTKILDGDFAEGYDPYRTSLPVSEKTRAILIGVIGALLLGFILIGIIAAIMSSF
ncbi:hypothetical protein [Singulisphaera sp. PoT]|uniref:hypothetical protein n=1 Tax=Singulisphaera sp. PoT TaxID=3411797 RepID=UPI003BF5C0FC